jgi:hypothetical protein
MTDERAFDVAAWLDQCGWTGEARRQAHSGFDAGWNYAADVDAGMLMSQSETDAYAAGEGHYPNGFDAGKGAYESGDYPGGLDNY